MPSIDPISFMKLCAEGKVDSRMKNPTQTHSQLKLERTYCALCGKQKGWVSQESSKYIAAMQIIVICDDCEKSMGSLPLEEAHITEILPR